MKNANRLISGRVVLQCKLTWEGRKSFKVSLYKTKLF